MACTPAVAYLFSIALSLVVMESVLHPVDWDLGCIFKDSNDGRVSNDRNYNQ